MHAHAPTKHAGICLRDLRSRQKVSQLDLALRVGVSQRHLSCIETGKASASKDMLLALLEGLDAPLSERNETLVTRFKSTAGELRFISTFTSFGAPLDITAASLRIEHLFPADDATRKVFS
jgi:transcriptional regulator with XRE-family HTH domain